MDKLKIKRGITLVSLVITIVIMLILAGVTISFIIGNNGLFKKANSAKNQYVASFGIQQIEHIWDEYVTDETDKDYTQELTLSRFANYVRDNNLLDIKDEQEDKLNIKIDNNYYDVSKSDNGISVLNLGEAPADPVIPDNKYYIYKDGVGGDNWDFVNMAVYSTPGTVVDENNVLNINDNMYYGNRKGLRFHTKNRYNVGTYTKMGVTYDIDTRVNPETNYSYFCTFATTDDQSLRYGNGTWSDGAWMTDTSKTVMSELDAGTSEDRQNQEIIIDITSLQGQDVYLTLCNQGIHVKVHSVWFE